MGPGERIPIVAGAPVLTANPRVMIGQYSS